MGKTRRARACSMGSAWLGDVSSTYTLRHGAAREVQNCHQAVRTAAAVAAASRAATPLSWQHQLPRHMAAPPPGQPCLTRGILGGQTSRGQRAAPLSLQHPGKRGSAVSSTATTAVQERGQARPSARSTEWQQRQARACGREHQGCGAPVRAPPGALGLVVTMTERRSWVYRTCTAARSGQRQHQFSLSTRQSPMKQPCSFCNAAAGARSAADVGAGAAVQGCQQRQQVRRCRCTAPHLFHLALSHQVPELGVGHVLEAVGAPEMEAVAKRGGEGE